MRRCVIRMRVLSVLAVAMATAACGRALVDGEHPLSGAMVAAADPLAVDAGLGMLRAGGSATVPAIATVLVLGQVEPES